MKNESKLPTLEMCQERLHVLDELSYRDMTDILEMPYLTGKSRTCQLNNLRSRFSFEKTGTKYIILAIYDDIIPLEAKNTYKSMIKIALMYYLKTVYGHEETLPASVWFTRLGMYNGSYLFYRKNPGQLYSQMTCLEGNENDRKKMFVVNRYQFHKYVDEYFHQIFKDCLKNLQDEKILNFYDCLMIYDGAQIEECLLDGGTHTVPNKRMADTEEEKTILDIEKSVLEQMLTNDKCKTYQYLKVKGSKYVKGYQKECDKQFKELFGFEEDSHAFYTHEIRIVFSDTYLDMQIDREMATLTRTNLNDKLLTWCYNKAQTYFDYLKRNHKYHEETVQYYSLSVQHELADRCIKL